MIRAQGDFEQWRFILDNKNTATDPNFEGLNKSLQTLIKELNVDLRNLQQVINVIEKSRQNFPQINDAELSSRKEFIAKTRSQVQSVDNVVNSDATRQKIQNNKRKDLIGASSGANAISQGRPLTGDQMVVQKRGDLRRREEETDEVLDDMSHALDRLTAASSTINTKLHVHQDLISEMDQEIDKTQDLMSASLTKMDVLLAKNRGGRLCCIAGLALAVIVMFMLIIYT